MRHTDTNFIKRCLTAVFVVVASSSLEAGETASVSVAWQDAAKYTDVRVSTGDSQDNFQKRVFDILGACIKSEAAEAMGSDRTLEVRILDLDLAGHVRFDYARMGAGVRVMKEAYPPSIDIEYSVKDADGKLKCSGRDKLTDPMFLSPGVRPLKSENLYYEKRLIKKWMSSLVKRSDCG